ncbi:conserved hypothetical protein [Planktothrix sp. PCC 11201]|nr:conserved hypothetical protein [Planktothrix sp. PCC 11201]
MTPMCQRHEDLMTLGMLLIPLVIWLPLALYLPEPNLVLWAMVAIVLAMLPALMVWLAYGR